MKRASIVLTGILLCCLSAWAAPKDQSWNGWISDSKCGAKGASASHEACAKKCIAGGEKPVLVADSDQKVLAIENPDAVKNDIGQRVTVTGTLTSAGAVHVDKVKTQ